MARQPCKAAGATLFLFVFCLVPGNGDDVCYSSSYQMGGICRNPASPTHVRATACYNSTVEEECISGVGKIVESLVTRSTCEASLSRHCEKIGGQLVPSPSCGHWCDAIGKSTLELCPNATSCTVSETSQCPEGLDASFFTGIEKSICCRDWRMVLEKGCVGHDCRRLIEYTSDLERTGSTESGCSTAQDCTRLDLDVGPFGLPFVENTIRELQARFANCLRRRPTNECYTASQRLPSICAQRNITWKFCAANQQHAQQCMEEMGSVAESLVTFGSCRSHMSSLCTAVGGTRKCTGNATCSFMCDAIERMAPLASSNSQASHYPISNTTTLRSLPAPTCGGCTLTFARCHTQRMRGLKRVPETGRRGPTFGLLSFYPTPHHRQLPGCLLESPCNSTTPCIEPAVCTKIPLRLEGWCDMLTGQSVFSQSVINDAFQFEETIKASWERLQPENFDKTRECREAFRQWLCTFNSQPCKDATRIPLCLDFCVAFQMCNRSLYATLSVNGTSDDPEIAAVRLCESMGIAPFSNRPGMCFNSKERPNLRAGAERQGSASVGLALSAAVFSLGGMRRGHVLW